MSIDYSPVLTQIVDLLTAGNAMYTSGRFWFMLFCTLMAVLLAAVMLFLFIAFFVRLFWRR